jgi:hypothetical protein
MEGNTEGDGGPRYLPIGLVVGGVARRSLQIFKGDHTQGRVKRDEKTPMLLDIFFCDATPLRSAWSMQVTWCYNRNALAIKGGQ